LLRFGLEPFKQSIIKLNYKKILLPIVLVFMPVAIVIGGLFIIQKIHFNEPEFLYEFGFSSLIDFPLYFIWNLPQLLIFYTFQKIIKENLKPTFIWVFISCMGFFIYEFIPLTESTLQLIPISEFIMIIILSVILVLRFNNFYLFSFLIFGLTWSLTLSFGSSSQIIVNIVLAKNYNMWEGFFLVEKSIRDFVNIALITLTIMFSFLIKAKKV
jgi:hypothetical protein